MVPNKINTEQWIILCIMWDDINILSKFFPCLLLNRTNLDPVEFIQFFNVLSSVLEYRTLVIEAFREMGRFIVNEHILSNNDVLILLFKWSIISKDMELQDDLHVVAQQYQIKELLSKYSQSTSESCHVILMSRFSKCCKNSHLFWDQNRFLHL